MKQYKTDRLEYKGLQNDTSKCASKLYYHGQPVIPKTVGMEIIKQ